MIFEQSSKLQFTAVWYNMSKEKEFYMATTPLETFRDLYNKHTFRDNLPNYIPLWHYTSVNGLMGIVQNANLAHGKLHFWFTRSDCLNDTSEGTHVLDLFKRICCDLLSNGQINNAFYECLKHIEIPNSHFVSFPVPSDEKYTHMSVLDCPECDAYICSFSLKEDSLDMWRYYSKGDGGYALNLYAFVFDEHKEYEYSDYDEKAVFSNISSYKVIYDEATKQNMLKNVILDTYKVYKQFIDREPDCEENAKGFIKHALKIFQFQFKHDSYASEQEYRFVFYRPRSKPELLQNDLPEIRYRSQNGVIVPYIDITVEGGALYLSEVLISPYIKNSIVQNTTKEYLSKCGFDCDVRHSDLPVR